MDDKDLRILSAVAEHKIHSPDKIHDVTGIPKSTVHYRLNQMRESGHITDDLLNVDLEKVGLSIIIISEIWAEYDEEYHRSVGEKISDINGVNQVYFTLGDTDFIAVTYLTSRETVEDLVGEFERIDEVERTSSTFVIKTIKNEPNPINDYPTESLIEMLL